MRRFNFTQFASAAFLVIVAKALFSPRIPIPVFRDKSTWAHQVAQHKAIVNSSLENRVLYLSGPLESLGNILVFTLIFIAVSKIAPRLKDFQLVLICAAISLSVETAQIFIPGRVSSLTDVDCNFLGIAVAFMLIKKFPNLFGRKKNYSFFLLLRQIKNSHQVARKIPPL